MRYDELLEIAKKGGAVVWLKSNRIEALSVKEGKVVATRIRPHRRHYINPDQGKEYACKLVRMNDSFPFCMYDWTDYGG